MSRRLIPLLFVLLLTPFTLTAQEATDHPPQFLYRDGDQLVLVSIIGDSSETIALPSINVGNEQDRFQWSTDGHYLLTLLVPDDEIYLRCMNLYDIDNLQWLYADPVACDVVEAAFSPDSATLAYSMNLGNNERLRLYDIEARQSRFITQTTDGYVGGSAYIGGVRWSPTAQYLFWQESHAMAGGGRSTLYLRNMASGFTYPITAGTIGYYASYNPIWSSGDEWFLLKMQEEYLRTNHQGDLYLIRAENGAQYRLTYTPAIEEWNIHWSENGDIEFDTVASVTFSLEEALNVPEPNVIVAPPSTLDTDYQQALEQFGYPSPYPEYEGWIQRIPISPTESTYQLEIFRGIDLLFSTPIPNNFEQMETIIGWRPTGNSDS